VRDEVSPESLEFIANRFKILAEPMRLRILHALQPGERTVTQVIEATGASQANISKHLGVLTRADMLGRRKEGLNVFYSISDPVIFELCDLVCGKLRATVAKDAARVRPSRR
jgi:DNA-binding transcriptional ArsR family regulator